MWRILVLALACAGCTNPDDILAARGTLVSVDPVEGQVVHLRRALTIQPTFFAGFVGEWCSGATPHKELQADAEGAFAVEIFRVETRRARCFRIDTTFPSGSVAWSDFSFSGPETRLPRLRDWRASPRLDGGVLQFEPPVPWPDDALPAQEGAELRQGIELTHRAQLVTADGGIAWQAEDRFQLRDASTDVYGNPTYGRGPLVLDEPRLEDFEGTLNLSASLSEPVEQGSLLSATPSPSRMLAAERPVLRGTRVPLSRGLACPELATPCPLTDGELTEVDAGLIEEVSLELATPALLSAAVLRDAWIAGELVRVVLVQGDGGIAGEFEGVVPKGAFGFRGFDSVRLRDGGYAQLEQAYMVIPLDAGTPASRVTVQFPGGLARVREISIFER